MTHTPIAIGDIQGCHSAFQSLLDKISAPADTPLWIAGDVVNRGPGSLASLRAVVDLGPRATVVLGNHDLHLLAVSAGLRTERPGDTIGEILDAPDADALLE
ncbi:metallophosphoesterase, partial [Alcaligenes phenolicus]